MLAKILLALAPAFAIQPHAGPLAPHHAFEEPAPALVAGTRVTLSAPAGHAPGQGFLGYQWADDAASLMVLEIPGEYAETAKGMTSEGLKKGGMTLIESTDTPIAGRDGQLLLVSQVSQGIVFRKWIALCGEGKRTLMMNASFPEELEATYSKPFRRALLGAQWDTKLEIDPFVVLPWTITKPEGLRFAGNLGTSLIYTEDGEFDQSAAPASARVIVSPSMGSAPVKDVRAFTESRARKLPPELSKSLEIVTSQEIEVPNRRAWEVVARTRHAKDSTELTVHVVIVCGEDDYVAFVSQCAHEKRDTWLSRFRACATSWKLKATERDPAPKEPATKEPAPKDERPK